MDADSGEWSLGGPAPPSPCPDSHLYQMPTERGKGRTQPGKRGNQTHKVRNQSVHPSLSQGTMSSPAYNTEDIITMTSMELTKSGKRGLVEYFPDMIF